MIEIILTDVMLRNGNIDFPTHVKDIFPSDCFGTRSSRGTGTINLRFGAEEVVTYIRIKSSLTISPRKRFGSWFKSVSAKSGGRVLLKKISERTFTLEYFSV